MSSELEIISIGLISGTKELVKETKTAVENIDMSAVAEQVAVKLENVAAGVPAPPLASLAAASTEEGIVVTFKANASLQLDGGATVDTRGNGPLAVTKGVMVRYSDVAYPKNKEDGLLAFTDEDVLDYPALIDSNSAPAGKEKSHTVIGLTNGTTYYFSAFPYSTNNVYNEALVENNCTTCTWTGSKGTITVNVEVPSGYSGSLSDYTITLVDQDGSDNVEEVVSGAGAHLIGNLESGKRYKVQLSDTTDLQGPSDSDVVTVTAGQNADITVAYSYKLGTITVNVSSSPANMPVGSYTVTLVSQDGGSNETKQMSGLGTATFSGLVNGKTYKATLSTLSGYSKTESSVLTVVGNSTVSATVTYTFSKTLSACSWAEISKISESGNASSYFSVGDTKSTTVSGETITTEIVGFNHDDLQSGGKAGITFGMKNLMASTRTMNSTNTNSGSFVGSAMYTGYLSTSFLTGLPSDLQAVIKTVNKKTGTGGGSSSGTRTDAVKIFLFAEVEVFGSTTCSVSGEGSQYSRFTNSSSRIKYLSNGSGSAYWWWLRSPYSGSSGSFCIVYSDGGVYYNSASNAGGVCAGFCV